MRIELHHHHHQDRRRHVEEAAQVDANGAAHEADAEQNREAEAQDDPREFSMPEVSKRTAASSSTVSTPSRKTIRKTNRKMPQRAARGRPEAPFVATEFQFRLSGRGRGGSSRAPC